MLTPSWWTLRGLHQSAPRGDETLHGSQRSESVSADIAPVISSSRPRPVTPPSRVRAFEPLEHVALRLGRSWSVFV